MMDSRRPIVPPLVMLAAMGAFAETEAPSIPYRPAWQPWNYTQLTKAERKGKTPEEIKALRYAKYKAETGEVRHADPT